MTQSACRLVHYLAPARFRRKTQRVDSAGFKAHFALGVVAALWKACRAFVVFVDAEVLFWVKGVEGAGGGGLTEAPLSPKEGIICFRKPRRKADHLYQGICPRPYIPVPLWSTAP